MTKTRDCDGNILNQFDLVENICQPGDFRFYFYCGTMIMSDYDGKTMAIFANKIFPNHPLREYQRTRDGRVMFMRKVKMESENDR